MRTVESSSRRPVTFSLEHRPIRDGSMSRERGARPFAGIAEGSGVRPDQHKESAVADRIQSIPSVVIGAACSPLAAFAHAQEASGNALSIGTFAGGAAYHRLWPD